eukprot:150182-Pelagomonas_calceolata.AAC.2
MLAFPCMLRRTGWKKGKGEPHRPNDWLHENKERKSHADLQFPASKERKSHADLTSGCMHGGKVPCKGGRRHPPTPAAAYTCCSSQGGRQTSARTCSSIHLLQLTGRQANIRLHLQQHTLAAAYGAAGKHLPAPAAA